MIYGYARVSADGQSVTAQVAGLRKHRAGKVFREVARRAQNRPDATGAADGRADPPPRPRAGARDCPQLQRLAQHDFAAGMTSSTKEGPPSKLTYLIRLLDHAVKAVPAARYFWGVIAASVTVAIIGLLNGLNRLTFVAMVAAFSALLICCIFSRVEKGSDP